MASDGDDDVVVARIPSDVIYYKILPRLPYKSLSRFKSACKKWYHLISHDIIFAREQSRHGSPISFGYVYQHKQRTDFIPIDIPGELNLCITSSSFFSLPIGVECLRIIAIVNGLFLLFLQRKSDEQNDSICSLVTKFHYVWNLVTKAMSSRKPISIAACYKLVNLVQQRKGLREEEFSFDVYSSRTGKWTMSDRKVTIPKGKRILWNIFCAGRIIYWACNPDALWFDVEKDVAGYTLLPQMEALGSRHVLGATNDGILTSTQMVQHDAITIWMMSEEGDWVKKVSLETVPTVSSEFKLFIPLPFTGGDRIYMEMLSYCMSKRILVCYNVSTREMTTIGEMKDAWPPSKCLYVDYNRIARLGFLK
ncbi:hypothetical protein C4D60_Mb06t36920 [Musa balbisiana]|uniref:F-box protein At3g26010-like beta-propeller domain-containing protein n=1 Tax=Musa balbisiana TaxID=52838 RepID=A0A4S8ITE1_MUSBA|nr:hypothetical protein C4D60_Mb06t36920 [Musa balbisiana]